jgi:hypothetical protein
MKQLASARIEDRLMADSQADLAALPFGSPRSAGTNRGDLKKRRRVEFHIEHREITVFAGGLAAAQSARAGFGASDGLQPHACPVCGSFQLLVLAEAVSSPDMDLRALQQGMQDGSVHMHSSADGAWWICAESLKKS